MTPDLADVPAEPGVEPGRAGPLKLIVRVGVGLGVFGFLIWRSDPAALLDTVEQARPAPLAAAAAALFAGLFVSALRWKAYLDALELSIARGTLFRLYFVGTFFNAFLPTGIGGDAYKAVRLGRRARGDYETLAPAFASVFLDRFAGVIGLAVVGLAGIGVELLAGDDDLSVALVALTLCAAILLSALVLLMGGERLLGRGRLIKHEGIGGKVRRAVRAIHSAGRHPGAAARGYAFGLLFQILVLAYHVLIGRALGFDHVSPAQMAAIVVVSSIATMIPLTVNGLGFREAAYVWGLGRFGVAQPAAAAFAVLVLVIVLLTSAAGGIVYLVAGGEVRRS